MRPSIWECAWPIFTKFSELVECGWEWPVSHSMDVAMVTNYGSKLAQCTIIYCICIPQPTGELQRWWAQYHQQWRLFNRQKFGEFWSSNPGVTRLNCALKKQNYAQPSLHGCAWLCGGVHHCHATWLALCTKFLASAVPDLLLFLHRSMHERMCGLTLDFSCEWHNIMFTYVTYI